MMMKWIYLWVCLGFTTALGAQTAGFLAGHIEGAVYYQADPGADPVRIFTGSFIGPAGDLRLERHAVAELEYQGQLLRLSKRGTYQVVSLLRQVRNRPRSNFLSRFWGFIRQGFNQSQTQEKLEKYHEENMTFARGSSRGFQSGGALGLKPYGGKINRESISFQWPGKVADFFGFRITDSLSNELVFKARSVDSTLEVNLADLYWQAGRTYYWEVFYRSEQPPGSGFQRGDPARRSPKVYFTVAAPGEEQELLQSLRRSEDYQNTDDTLRQSLMEALVLEEAGFLWRTQQLYERLYIQSPADPTVRRLYATFLARHQQLDKAKQILFTP